MTRLDDQMKEIVDRCRRIETRITKFLETQGFDTKVRRPHWQHGVITIPSMSCAMNDCLSVVPSDWDPNEEILVVHQDKEIMSFYTAT